jgi:hypothetical protein
MRTGCTRRAGARAELMADANGAYDLDPLEPPPAGRVLVCCSRPASEIALEL